MSHTFQTRARLETASEFVQSKNAYFTSIREPSPDNYTNGNSFRVQSQGPLGQAGQEVDLEIKFTNWIKIDRFNDKVTRQPVEIHKNIAGYEVLKHQPATDIQPVKKAG